MSTLTISRSLSLPFTVGLYRTVLVYSSAAKKQIYTKTRSDIFEPSQRPSETRQSDPGFPSPADTRASLLGDSERPEGYPRYRSVQEELQQAFRLAIRGDLLSLPMAYPDGTEGQPGASLRDRKGRMNPILENPEGVMGEIRAFDISIGLTHFVVKTNRGP